MTDVITITWQDPESTDKRRVISYNMIPLLALGLVCVTGWEKEIESCGMMNKQDVYKAFM